MAFSKSLPKGQIPVGCQLCESRNKIEWKCTDCNLLMCDRCKEKVHLRIANDHSIVNIKDLREHEDTWDSFVFSDFKCQDHPNKFCSLYCRTCNKVICLKCVVKVHNGHNFVDEEEFADKKEKLKDGQKKILMNLSKLSPEKETRKSHEDNEDHKHKNLRQNILDQEKKLHSAVGQYADNLVQDVERHCRIMKQEEDTKIDEKIKKIHAKNEALESIITTRDFKQFFEDFDELSVSLNEDMSQNSIYSCPIFVPGKFTLLNFGTLEESRRFRKHHSIAELKVTNQWTTELKDVHFIVECNDSTLWIADFTNYVMQHVKLEKDKVKILSVFDNPIFGIVDISDNILVSTGLESNLKLINGKTHKVTDSVYDISPFIPGDVFVNKDQKVFVTGTFPWSASPPTGRVLSCIVAVMDQTGKRLIQYEKDSKNKPLFTYPFRVASTRNGNVFVVDSLDKDFRGRVVVMDPVGNIKGIYTGHPEVNTEHKPFTPSDLFATPSDYILVVDWKIHVVHILNNESEFVSYYCLDDIGIRYPTNLALSKSGRLYIGAGLGEKSQHNFRAKIYEVEYSGI